MLEPAPPVRWLGDLASGHPQAGRGGSLALLVCVPAEVGSGQVLSCYASQSRGWKRIPHWHKLSRSQGCGHRHRHPPRGPAPRCSRRPRAFRVSHAPVPSAEFSPSPSPECPCAAPPSPVTKGKGTGPATSDCTPLPKPPALASLVHRPRSHPGGRNLWGRKRSGRAGQGHMRGRGTRGRRRGGRGQRAPGKRAADFCVYLRTSDKEESLSSDLGGQRISWIRGREEKTHRGRQGSSVGGRGGLFSPGVERGGGRGVLRGRRGGGCRQAREPGTPAAGGEEGGGSTGGGG